MRFVGRLADWNDAKGYGFVEPNCGGERAFVHVKTFGRLSKRPADGAMISYAVKRDAQSRVTALDVRFVGTQMRASATPSPMPRKSIAAIFALLLACGWWFSKIPNAVVCVYAATSVLAFAIFGFDKSAARDGGWRIQESKLHLIDLLGGWPGGLVAQDVFRHKSKKGSFQATFWLTVLVNCAVMVWLLKSGRI